MKCWKRIFLVAICIMALAALIYSMAFGNPEAEALHVILAKIVALSLGALVFLLGLDR